MFRRQPPARPDGITLVSFDTIETYQRGADQKDTAQALIDSTREELPLKGLHVWRAPDETQAQLSLATIALTQDRTAELLCAAGKQDTKQGPVIPQDVEEFARALSKNALATLKQAQQMTHGLGQPIVFDDAWRESLQPEAQLPYWPNHLIGNETPGWQGDTLGVSMEFLRGIFSAAQEIHAVCSTDLTHIQKTTDLPPEFASMPSILGDLIETTAIDLATAGDYLQDSHAELPAELRGDTYLAVHDGYTGAVYVSLALVAPQILGPDFAPQS